MIMIIDENVAVSIYDGRAVQETSHRAAAVPKRRDHEVEVRYASGKHAVRNNAIIAMGRVGPSFPSVGYDEEELRGYEDYVCCAMGDGRLPVMSCLSGDVRWHLPLPLRLGAPEAEVALEGKSTGPVTSEVVTNDVNGPGRHSRYVDGDGDGDGDEDESGRGRPGGDDGPEDTCPHQMAQDSSGPARVSVEVRLHQHLDDVMWEGDDAVARKTGLRLSTKIDTPVEKGKGTVGDGIKGLHRLCDYDVGRMNQIVGLFEAHKSEDSVVMTGIRRNGRVTMWKEVPAVVQQPSHDEDDEEEEDNDNNDGLLVPGSVQVVADFFLFGNVVKRHGRVAVDSVRRALQANTGGVVYEASTAAMELDFAVAAAAPWSSAKWSMPRKMLVGGRDTPVSLWDIERSARKAPSCSIATCCEERRDPHPCLARSLSGSSIVQEWDQSDLSLGRRSDLWAEALGVEYGCLWRGARQSDERRLKIATREWVTAACPFPTQPEHVFAAVTRYGSLRVYDVRVSSKPVLDTLFDERERRGKRNVRKYDHEQSADQVGGCSLTAVAVRPNGSQVLVGDSVGRIRLYDLKRGGQVVNSMTAGPHSGAAIRVLECTKGRVVRPIDSPVESAGGDTRTEGRTISMEDGLSGRGGSEAAPRFKATKKSLVISSGLSRRVVIHEIDTGDVVLNAYVKGRVSSLLSSFESTLGPAPEAEPVPVGSNGAPVNATDDADEAVIDGVADAGDDDDGDVIEVPVEVEESTTRARGAQRESVMPACYDWDQVLPAPSGDSGAQAPLSRKRKVRKTRRVKKSSSSSDTAPPGAQS